jgi:hypothetical protein
MKKYISVFGPNLTPCCKHRHGLVDLLLARERVAESELRLGELAVDLDRLAERGLGGHRVVEAELHRADAAVGLGRTRIELGPLLELGERRLPGALLLERLSQPDVRGRIRRRAVTALRYAATASSKRPCARASLPSLSASACAIPAPKRSARTAEGQSEAGRRAIASSFIEAVPFRRVRDGTRTSM